MRMSNRKGHTDVIARELQFHSDSECDRGVNRMYAKDTQD